MNKILSVSNLTKSYRDKTALDNFTMEVGAGQIVALIGENGAGKTTLLNAICDFIRPTSGEILFNGKNLKEEKSFLKRLGILIEPSFLDYLTAEENLQYLMKLSGGNKSDKKIEDLLNKTELYESRKKKVKTFSFGMKQRLGLCQSLLTDVNMLIFDEPFVGLDPIGKDLFKKVIKNIAHIEGVPVLFSSHDLDDVDEICDRVIMIRGGKKTMDRELLRRKTYILQIDGIASKGLATKLQESNPDIHCEKNHVTFQEEALMIDIQKTLLEEGYYIVGVSIQNNNLRDSFFGGGQ